MESSCGDVGYVLRPDRTEFPCFVEADVESQPWMNATSVRIDATSLSNDIRLHFRHQATSDMNDYDVSMNSWGTCTCESCAALCPQLIISPGTISRTGCTTSKCDVGGMHIVATAESYDPATRQWGVTLEAECFGELGAAPATAASALLLAAVCGAAALPLLPLRVLFGRRGASAARGSGGGSSSSRWLRVAAGCGAAAGLAAVLLASGDLSSSTGGGTADALSSCGCGATSGLIDVTVTFYHAAGVLVGGESSANMQS
jgi:hypothetical protein